MLSTTYISLSSFPLLSAFALFPPSLLSTPPSSISLSVAVGYLAVHISMLESLVPLAPVLPVSLVESVYVCELQAACV